MNPGPLFDPGAARELFRSASVWRGAVIGGAVFTVLAAVFAPSSPRPSGTYTPPRPVAAPPSPAPVAPTAPTGPTVPTTSNQGPIVPVAPAVPKILPSAQADMVAEPPAKKDGQFGEAEEGEQPDGHIRPGQPLDH